MFKHSKIIPSGKRGEFSKVTEEVAELEDALLVGGKLFAVIESADVLDAVGTFAWRKYRVPFLALVAFSMSRRIYKRARRLICGPKKH